MTRRSLFASLAALVGVTYAPKPQAFIGVDWGFSESVTVYHTYSLPPERLAQRHTMTTFSMPPVRRPRKLGFITDEP